MRQLGDRDDLEKKIADLHEAFGIGSTDDDDCMPCPKCDGRGDTDCIICCGHGKVRESLGMRVRLVQENKQLREKLDRVESKCGIIEKANETLRNVVSEQGTEIVRRANVDGIVEWLHSDERKSADLAFTSGPERRLADELGQILDDAETQMDCANETAREFAKQLSACQAELMIAKVKADAWDYGEKNGFPTREWSPTKSYWHHGSEALFETPLEAFHNSMKGDK